MQASGLIWVTAEGRQMTLAELGAFVAEAREAGVPEDASPYVGTSWRGGISRIAVSRPLPGRAPAASGEPASDRRLDQGPRSESTRRDNGPAAERAEGGAAS